MKLSGSDKTLETLVKEIRYLGSMYFFSFWRVHSHVSLEKTNKSGDQSSEHAIVKSKMQVPQIASYKAGHIEMLELSLVSVPISSLIQIL